jgi:putative CocE/NonD family hydrolase
VNVVTDLPRPVRDVEHCWIPMSDGCRLAARLWFPEGAEASPVPAILEYIPYRKRDFSRPRDEPIHRYFAGHGYAAVRVDVRGSGDSEGLLPDEYHPQELADALEVIAWIAAQPWCDGRVGMMGKSWGGINALQVAAQRPPALRAIITVCSTDDRYTDDAHYMGGCLLNENFIWGSALFTLGALPPDPVIVGARWRAMWHERLAGAVPFSDLWLRHQHRDAYWRRGSVREDYGRIACPVYAVGGWADAYSNAVPRLLSGLTVPRKGLVGPWAHVYPHDGVPGPAIGFLQEALRWWDHWLRDRDTGIMDEPTYRVWMQESVPPHPYYDQRPGRWIAEAAWPSPHVVPWRLALDVGRLADHAGPETRLECCSPQGTGLAGGEWCPFGVEGEMPTDQRTDAGGSLVFDSRPLAAPVEILGAPALTLALAVDRPVALVAVRLNDLAPDGSSTRVTYGVLNLAHREGHEHPAALEPGRRYTVRVALNDVAHAFPAAHVLRLAISTCYWPLVWPAPEPATLAVFTGASRLELPVRPPRPEDARLRPFPPPERAPPPVQTLLHPAPLRRSIERDARTGETIYTVTGDAAGFNGAALARLEAIGLDLGHTIARRHRVSESDPTSARSEIEHAIQLRRGEWSVRVNTRTRVSATARAFRVETTLEAFERDERVFTRQWDRTVPRDLV